MSNINPLVKETAAATINRSIDCLGLLTTLLDNTVELASRDEAQSKHLSTAEVAALSLQLGAVQLALEQGYEQCVKAGS
jgi:hypothetical protein